MKALIREKGETITEYMGITGIDWTNGMPLTGPDWAGGPYKLIRDYEPYTEDSESGIENKTDPESESESETVVIDGVEYRRV